MVKYIVVNNNRIIGFYNNLNEAIEAIVEIGGGEIYRVELVAKINEEEAHSLREIVLSTSIEPVEAPVVPRKTIVSRNVAVLDRCFTDEHIGKLAELYRDLDMYLMKTGGSGVEKKNNINYVYVESSLDVCSFVEELVAQNYRVIVFTCDKKLYTHLSKKPNVIVFYKLIEEYSSVDDLIESISNDIRKAIGG